MIKPWNSFLFIPCINFFFLHISDAWKYFVVINIITHPLEKVER